ncbi:hypothetical protein L2E82_12344 [Cichorium intybus]|uniref:Uncharacterized protein n=1 Tax=Cichorium intybus TaxID=13427 RepID=A0ACB9GFN3_CICIN|nr:hypothetical protein L2E82_12344 [Cichorium intybus]
MVDLRYRLFCREFQVPKHLQGKRNGGITPRPTPLTEAKIETLGYDDCKTLALLAAAVRICHRRRFFSFLVIVVAFLISPTQ